MKGWTACSAAAWLIGATAGLAQEQISEAKASFIFNEERVKISQGTPDAVAFIETFAAPTSACGAGCVVPMQAARGVPTLGEIEVLAFLTDEVAGNAGLMVDARAPQDRAKGFIPGSVSLPQHTLSESNSFRDDILRALGARDLDGVFDFTNARALLVYDTGPGSDDAGKLISKLMTTGYPAEKLFYYRGGMQVWTVLGFSIEKGQG
ncbi:rhodanese-like domain-containing protein [Sulfitobacter aestuariivivens]|uniref:Rhodanese-like domain-containing protein n=1 Tax=Sulfitobacter aestuariivivens TaxID=2766981 RepID=A0A927D679_9RHOB|nr:rhodanese-like domain-containing protein [Sulfitobacter aestuariivivens]MBD3665765.1 rhodanese-like domain-containing protein [Sulfitobacter aestuariivivens]